MNSARQFALVSSITTTFFLTLTTASSAYAHDSDRIDLLEKELIETQRKLIDTRKRLAILESMIRDEGIQPVPTETDNTNDLQSDSDKGNQVESQGSNANWQTLSVGMGMGKVQEILGEPESFKGNKVMTWYYKNGGSTTFWDGYLKKWTLPN